MCSAIWSRVHRVSSRDVVPDPLCDGNDFIANRLESSKITQVSPNYVLILAIASYNSQTSSHWCLLVSVSRDCSNWIGLKNPWCSKVVLRPELWCCILQAANPFSEVLLPALCGEHIFEKMHVTKICPSYWFSLISDDFIDIQWNLHGIVKSMVLFLPAILTKKHFNTYCGCVKMKTQLNTGTGNYDWF